MVKSSVLACRGSFRGEGGELSEPQTHKVSPSSFPPWVSLSTGLYCKLQSSLECRNHYWPHLWANEQSAHCAAAAGSDSDDEEGKVSEEEEEEAWVVEMADQVVEAADREDDASVSELHPASLIPAELLGCRARLTKSHFLLLLPS